MSDKADKTSVQSLKIQIRRTEGKIFGPYSRRDVLGFIHAKKLDGSEQILLEGTDRWKSINSDTEFFDALQEVYFGVAPKKSNYKQKNHKKSSETILGGEPTSVNDPSEKGNTGNSSPSEDPSKKSKIDTKSSKIKTPDFGLINLENEKILKNEKTKVLSGANLSTKIVEEHKEHQAKPFEGFVSSPAETQSLEPRAPLQAAKPRKKNNLIPFLMIVLIGLFFLFTKKNNQENDTKSQPLTAQSVSQAPAYFRPLLLRISPLFPLSIPDVPENLKKSVEVSLPPGFGAHVFSEEVKLFLSLSPEQRLTSDSWIRLAWSLGWLAQITEVYDKDLGQQFFDQAEKIVKNLKNKNVLSPDFERLYSQIQNISQGNFLQAQNELALGTDEHSRWLHLEVSWLRFWRGELSAENVMSLIGNQTFTSTAFEASTLVKRFFLQKSQDTVFWLDQLAVEDPESFNLWFVSAQYFWRVQSAFLQKAYLFWVSGLGAASLYPKSYQVIYLEQMSALIKLFGRQDPANQILDNSKMVDKKNVLANIGTWKPVLGSVIDVDQLTDEILDSGSSQRLAPIRLASLQNLAFTVSRKGGRKLLQVGHYWMFEKNYKRALETFETATTFEDSKLESWGSKVWLHAEMFQFDEALKALDKVNTHSKGSSDNNLYDAILHFFARDYEYAKTKMELFLKVSPGSGLGHYFNARIHEAMGKNIDCAKAAYLGGTNGQGEIGFRSRLLFYRCRVLGGIQISAALADLQKMYLDDPSNTAAVTEYIRSLSEAQLTDQAILVGREAVEKFPRSYELRLALGDAYLKARDYNKALAFYNNARRFRPNSAEAFLKIADLLFVQDRSSEAAENYRVAAQLNPEYPEIWLKAAQAYRKAKNKDQAIFAYSKELEMRPSVVQTFVDFADYFLELSLPQAVVDLHQKHKASLGNDPRVSLRLAQAFLGLQNFERARERASATQIAMPDHPESYKILGIIADMEGNYPSAKRYFSQYIRLIPQAADADIIRKKISQPPYSD